MPKLIFIVGQQLPLLEEHEEKNVRTCRTLHVHRCIYNEIKSQKRSTL